LGEDLGQLLWRHNFELRVSAIARLLVRPPPSKLRDMAKAAALHVVISDFDYKLGPQRLPGQIFALAPSALAARHALLGAIRCVFGPMLPWVRGKSVLSVRRQVVYKLTPDPFGEARADSDMLQRAGFVEKTEQQRAESGSGAVLVPSKPGDD